MNAFPGDTETWVIWRQGSFLVSLHLCIAKACLKMITPSKSSVRMSVQLLKSDTWLFPNRLLSCLLYELLGLPLQYSLGPQLSLVSARFSLTRFSQNLYYLLHPVSFSVLQLIR